MASQKDEELRKQKELEATLESSGSMDLSKYMDQSNLERVSELPEMSFNDEYDMAKRDAEKIISGLVDFYFSGVAVNRDYINRKKLDEIETLANILYQQRTLRWTTNSLMEEVKFGQKHARNFEVLGSLQAQMTNANNQKQTYIKNLEENFKKMRVEHEALDKYEEKKELPESTDDNKIIINNTTDGLKTRGTRELMKTIREDIKDIKDITEIKDAPVIDITDARKKFLIEQEQEKKESEENIDESPIDEDLF